MTFHTILIYWFMTQEYHFSFHLKFLWKDPATLKWNKFISFEYSFFFSFFVIIHITAVFLYFSEFVPAYIRGVMIMIWVLMQVRKFSKIKENKFSDDARSGVNQRPWPVGSKWAREPLYQSLYFIYHILLYTATQLITGHQLYCWRARIFSGQTSWGPDTEIKIRFWSYIII